MIDPAAIAGSTAAGIAIQKLMENADHVARVEDFFECIPDEIKCLHRDIHEIKDALTADQPPRDRIIVINPAPNFTRLSPNGYAHTFLFLATSGTALTFDTDRKSVV